jgi:hypothetical protein
MLMFYHLMNLAGRAGSAYSCDFRLRFTVSVPPLLSCCASLLLQGLAADSMLNRRPGDLHKASRLSAANEQV